MHAKCISEKYSHKNYDQVMMQKKFLISEIPRIFLNINAQCTGFLSSLTGESGGGRDLHYLTKKPNNSDDQHEYLNKG